MAGTTSTDEQLDQDVELLGEHAKSLVEALHGMGVGPEAFRLAAESLHEAAEQIRQKKESAS